MVKIFTVFIKGGDGQCINLSVRIFMAFIKFARESSQPKDVVSRVYLKWKLKNFYCFAVLCLSSYIFQSFCPVAPLGLQALEKYRLY